MSRTEDRKNAFKLLFSDSFGVEVSDFDSEFTKELFFGVKNNKELIDNLIKSNIKNWKFDRISRVAKCAMRLSIYEMLKADVPVAVAVNESVEIAKIFGSEEEANYVQAVLSAVSLSYNDYLASNDLKLKS